MSNVRHEFPDKTVLGVAYSMLIMTSSVLAVRIAVNIKIPKPLNTSDHLLFLSFACFATMCSLYISMVPRMKRIYGVSLGEHPPYAGMKDDSAIIYRLIFGSFCLFWMTLWCIKFSLLFLYRKLLAGLSRTYTFVWWALFGLCVIVSCSRLSIRP